MKEALSTLMLMGAFVLIAVLVTGAYQDVDGAVAWVSTVAKMA